MKKYILLLLLATFGMQAQTLQNPTYGNVKLKNNQTSTTATKVNVQENDGTINTISKSDLVNYLEFASAVNLPVTGEQGKLYLTKDNNKIYRWNGTFYQELTTDISGKEDIVNKQNSLSVDGSNTKYPTVTAVNTGLGLKENILNNPITGVGSQNNANTYALQDGTGLYHSTKWFVPSGAVSTIGATVTSVGTQFTSAMVGAKLTINGEWRVITAYTNSTTVITQSGYSQNYSNVVAENWGCYSRCLSITSTGSVNYYSYQGVVMFAYTPSDQFNVRFSGFSIAGNEVAIQPGGALLRDSAKIFWSNNATYYGTKDLGLRRNSAGVLEIYDGITPTVLEANRRDLLARNLFGSKVLIGSIVDDNINRLQVTGTISSGTTALNNTPPTANNQLTRKDYVDSGLASKEPSFTKNTAFNKNFGTTAGTVVEGGTLGSNAYTSTDYFKYETFSANANTLPGNRSAFTYAINAPHVGPIAHFAADGYGMQINTNSSNGDSFSFRTLNGDISAWNPWRKVWHDGNFNPGNYLPLSGGTLSGNITATAFFQSSDRRLKTILKRDGDIIYFKWKDGRDDKMHIGYVAQEVQEKHPNQVQADEKGMLSVNYIEILVEKIRVLEKRIEQFEKK